MFSARDKPLLNRLSVYRQQTFGAGARDCFISPSFSSTHTAWRTFCVLARAAPTALLSYNNSGRECNRGTAKSFIFPAPLKFILRHRSRPSERTRGVDDEDERARSVLFSGNDTLIWSRRALVFDGGYDETGENIISAPDIQVKLQKNRDLYIFSNRDIRFRNM